MTQDELNTLSVVATNVKWIMEEVKTNSLNNNCDHKTIIKHLSEHNVSLGRQWLAIIGCYTVLGVIITILLHLIGVY